jgi:hypothetical protein
MRHDGEWHRENLKAKKKKSAEKTVSLEDQTGIL